MAAPALRGDASLLSALWPWLLAPVLAGAGYGLARARGRRQAAGLRQRLDAVQAHNQRLRRAQELVGLGKYDWNADTGALEWSPGVFAIHGRDPAGGITIEQAFAGFDANPPELLAELNAQALAGQSSGLHELRITRADGSTGWVLCGGELYTVDGQRHVWGVQQDITGLVEARERLRAAEAQYRFLFEHNPLPMWVFDRQTLAFLAANDAMLAHYGYSREELLALTLVDIRPPAEVATMREAVAVIDRDTQQGRVWTHLRRDGTPLRMAIHAYDIEFQGRPARLVAAQDVTERERSDERFRLIARATSDAIYDYDVRTGQLWWGDSFFQLFGYDRRTLLPTIEAWEQLVHPEDRARVVGSLQAAMDRGDVEWAEEYRFRHVDGHWVEVIDRGLLARDAAGQVVRMVGGMLDISERHHYEAQLAHRATHDELTGLPNRVLLDDRLQQAVHAAARQGQRATVVFIDLDDFKLVNDTLGHSAGDAALREIARRLQSVVRDADTVGRFGGDEFVVVLAAQAHEDRATELVARIREELARPLPIGEVVHTLTASIGYCSYPEDGEDAETLLMHADLAMYQAKRRGRNRAVAYQPEFDAGVSRRLQLLTQLREALERREFMLDFQPLFAPDGRPLALEALVRWRHPTRGVLMPGEFIGVCEESGLIVELGRRVLWEAARHHGLLAQAGLGHLRIAVNVSAAQFNDDLYGVVEATMREFRLPPGILELELTESVIMEHPTHAIELMQRLAALGVSFSVDDFGTGYSSLAYLKRFPIERLKIDRSFVQDLGVDEDDAAICQSIIGLAHSLEIGTVAEGVETEQQRAWLRARGCDELQGYLLGRPQPFETLLPTLQAARPGDAAP